MTSRPMLTCVEKLPKSSIFGELACFGAFPESVRAILMTRHLDIDAMSAALWIMLGLRVLVNRRWDHYIKTQATCKHVSSDHLDNCSSHFVREARPHLHDFCQVRVFKNSGVVILSSICQVVFGSPLFTRVYDVLSRTSNPKVGGSIPSGRVLKCRLRCRERRLSFVRVSRGQFRHYMASHPAASAKSPTQGHRPL